MVARRELRRRAFFDRLFEEPLDEGEPGGIDPDRAGFEIRLSRPQVGVAERLAKVFDGNDELLVHPRRIVVDTRVEGIVDQVIAAGFRRVDTDSPPTNGVEVFEVLDNTMGARQTVDRILTTVQTLRGDGNRAVAPQYAFLTAQTTHPSEDAELVAYVERPDPMDPRGSGVRVCVLDTGWSATCPWTTANQRFLPANDNSDDLYPGAPDELGFAAGHGSFIGGVIHQLVPSAGIEILRVATTDGIVLEPVLIAAIDTLTLAASHGGAPDVLVLPFGGYSLSLSFGLAGPVAEEWADPVGLRIALERLVEASPGLVIVASAGNDGSSDPCFPAAFAAPIFGGPKLSAAFVSVAGLDLAGYRAEFSNFGDWVTAAALGVRVRSAYVIGEEAAGSDPDGFPERWGHPAYARWSGTSFAAPIVAAAIARQKWELEISQSVPVSARQAWSVVAGRASTATDMPCPWIDHAGVAHD